MTKWRRGAPGGFLAAVLLATGLAAQSAGSRLYVTNQDDATVSVIDLATRKLVETVDFNAMGFGPNAKPHHVQVEPDGSYWYLTLIGAGKVLKLDRTNHIVGSVDLSVPGLLSIHPTKDLLVVAKSMSAVNPPKRVAVIRRSDMTLLEEYDSFFPRPHGVVVDPRGDYVYFASLGVNQLASLRLDDGTMELVDVEGPSHTLTQLSVSPDAHWLAATASTSGNLLLFDISHPAKPVFAKAIRLRGGPFESVFSHDGTLAFVTLLDANQVAVLDASTWETVATVSGEGFQQPHGVALSPDGQYLFVSNRYQAGGAHDHEGKKPTGAGTLVAICIPTRSVATVVGVGHYAAGIGAPVPPARPATPAGCR